VDRPTETSNTSEPWKAVLLSAGTPPEWGTLLSMARSRLSDIERGYVTPSPEELARTAAALGKLIEAKSSLDRVAASLGWPGVRRDK
jgi:hypothetical protein